LHGLLLGVSYFHVILNDTAGVVVIIGGDLNEADDFSAFGIIHVIFIEEEVFQWMSLIYLL
jgi:hypothetical protein